MDNKLVEIKGLMTRFKVGNQWAEAVNGIDLDVLKGEILGIVGESGSGKSVSVLSLIQLIPNPPGEVSEGTIKFKGQTIFDGEELKRIQNKPKFRNFNSISDNLRKFFLLSSVVIWIYLSLTLINPILVKIPVTIVGIFGISYFWFNSPFKESMRKYREKIFKNIRMLRGDEIAMIFQEPMTSLNPVYTIGMQIIESFYAKSFTETVKDGVISVSSSLRSVQLNYRIIISTITGLLFFIFFQLGANWTFKLNDILLGLTIGGLLPSVIAFTILLFEKLIPEDYFINYENQIKEAEKLLDMVGIPDARKRLSDYPHQFSGGMRQRVMIAMALAKKPSLLIADEPTTALDVTIQAQILDLMLKLKEDREDASVVLITHDLAVIAETCERVVVMYGGKIQEIANVNDLFDNPLHPYTQGLLKSIPNPESEEKIKRLETIPGMVPNILDMPSGCKFCTRCDLKEDICESEEPPLINFSDNHFVRCHLIEKEETSQATA